MTKIIATCLVFALFGWGDASKVESLVYEDYNGTLLCKCCSSDWHCPLCMTHGERVTCKHVCREYTHPVRHPIKNVSAKRKKGVSDIWVVTMQMTCPKRGDVTGVNEWSYRNGKVGFIRKVEN